VPSSRIPLSPGFDVADKLQWRKQVARNMIHMQQTVYDKEAIAYHEAGHVVVNGLKGRYIKIVVIMDPHRGFSDWINPIPLPPRDAVVTLAAGVVAESKRSQLGTGNGAGKIVQAALDLLETETAEHDKARMLEEIQQYGQCSPNDIRQGVEQAYDILSDADVWDALSTVANELLEQWEMSGSSYVENYHLPKGIAALKRIGAFPLDVNPQPSFVDKKALELLERYRQETN
jgi:hypothetical protein